MNFIPFEETALNVVERAFGWRRAIVPQDRFANLAAPFQALDFSDFLLFCRDDLPDDIAYTIAALLCETPGLIESQYRHIPPRDSPITYPLDPKKIATASIPLAAGALTYYRDHSFL